MVNRFCPLSKKIQPPMLKGQYSKWIEYKPKSNEKCMPFLHCISSFEGSSYKNV